jgi:hypothetical protein
MRQLLLSFGLFVGLCATSGCKKDSHNNQTPTFSYVVDSLATDLNGPYATPWDAYPKVGLLPDSVGQLSASTLPATNLTGVNLGIFQLVLSFHFPFASQNLIIPGMYTYQLPSLTSSADSLLAQHQGLLMVNGQTNHTYRVLLSDTVTITTVSINALASGTFEATFLNRLGGDSVTHVSKGVFSNLSFTDINQIPPNE